MAERPEVALPEHFTETTAPIFHQAQHFCDSSATGLETVLLCKLLRGFLAAAEFIRNTQGDPAGQWAQQPQDRAEQVGMEVRESFSHLLIADPSLKTPLSPYIQTHVI